MKKAITMICILSLAVSCLFALPASAFAGTVGWELSLPDMDLSDVFSSLDGDFDPSSIKGIFESLGGSAGEDEQKGTSRTASATDADSPLDKIKNLFGDTANSTSASSSSSSSASDEPAVSHTVRYSEDKKTIYVDIYLENGVGTETGTIEAHYSGISFQYAAMGEDAKKTNEVKGTGFVAEANTATPGRVIYVFYFNDPLWDTDKMKENAEKDLGDFRSEHFHLATLVFSNITPESTVICEANCNMLYNRITDSFVVSCYNVDAIPLPGDVDGDGELSAADARLALRASVRLESYEPGTPAFAAADVNHDNTIGSDDARSILRASVKLETLA